MHCLTTIALYSLRSVGVINIANILINLRPLFFLKLVLMPPTGKTQLNIIRTIQVQSP